MENTVISIGKNEVDVVPLGTDRLLNLTYIIMCKCGDIMRELNQGQDI